MLDYCAAITSETTRLIEVAATVRFDTPVPDCPGWTVGDLVAHMHEVQVFWTWIVEGGRLEPDDFVAPARPPDAALLDALRHACTAMVDVLRSADPTMECWSWSWQQDAAFTIRHQAHEACVHRVDAERAAGVASIVDPELAADGIREMIVYSLVAPMWSSVAPEGDVVRLVAIDTMRSWTLRLTTWSGTSPTSGTTYADEQCVVLLADVHPAADAFRNGISLDYVVPGDLPTPTTTIAAPTAALSLWLWGRGSAAPLDVRGHAANVERLRAIAAAGSE